MRTDNLEYRGFIKLFDRPVNKLVSKSNIIPIASADRTLQNISVELNMLWDTGASLTFIKPRVKEQLKLRVFGTDYSIHIAGIGGKVKADLTTLSICITNSLIIECLPVYVVDFPLNYDMVIGMNIINMGDFSVCSTDMKTSFSFIIPPLPDRINYADIADALNNQKKS
jgi:hypothetical protein